MSVVAATKVRGVNDVLAEITAGAQRVSIATRSWPAFLPRLAALDEVQTTLTGLQRSVAELRSAMESQTK
jgi:hypothetical protein